MHRIAVILARAGSKRLPNKNKIILEGKYLIEYTIEAAIKANIFDLIVISTDDIEIKNICRKKYGNYVIMVERPYYLACDSANSEESVLHALDTMYKATGIMSDWVCLLQPTSPLRTHRDIQEAIYMAEYANKPIHSRDDKKCNGAIYYMKVNELYRKRRFDCESYVYKMPNERSVDIDTIEDLKKAEKVIGKI